MKKSRVIVSLTIGLLLYAAASAAQAADEPAAPSVSGPLHVEGTNLVGQNGESVQLRGISTHGLAWFPDYVNEACFQQLHDEWGANVIRLAMYTSEYNGYCNGGDREYLKGLIEDGVAYAAAQDMYAIIDWHILSDSNPNIHKEEAMAFFAEISAKYKNADNVIYEICNEPNGNTTWAEVKSYAEEVIEVIRANDADGVILVGTPNWCQYVDQAASDPITGYDNIMYTLHFYAATHKDDLRERMVSAIEAGLPVFVSEYGICDASGNGALDIEQANAWVDVMNEHHISYVLWSLSNKDESASILKSSCSRTSGFTEEDLSPCGQWAYQMLSKKEITVQTETSGDKEEPNEKETEGRTATLASGDITIDAELVNNWESEGKTFYQYNLTLTNNGADCSYWSVDLAFAEDIALSDGWNGDYAAQGNTLHITNKGYNGEVPAGGTVEEVGFIVSGGRELLTQ